MLWLWILCAVVGAVLYINIGIDIKNYTLKKEKYSDEVGGYLAGIFWPIVLGVFILLPTVGLLWKIVTAPQKISGLYRSWRERKTARLLAAHQADPLQEELRELIEVRRQKKEKECELAELKRKEQALEARNVGTYREPPRVAELWATANIKDFAGFM